MAYLNGIDVSSAQTGIDTGRVPADFVIVKVNQSTGYVNPDWRRQAERAQAAGRLVGLYDYAGSTDPTAEADCFIRQARGWFGRAALFIDFEQGENPGYARGAAWTDAWCRRVDAASGTRSGVYIGQRDLYRFQDVGRPLWVAQYGTMAPQYGYDPHPWNEGAYPCSIRQYSSAGRLAGWAGNLDLDKFYGSRQDWNNLFKVNGGAEMALTNDEIDRIAQAVWQYKPAGKGVQAQDRLYGMDALQLPAISKAVAEAASKTRVDALAAKVDELAAAQGKVAEAVARVEHPAGVSGDVSGLQEAIGKQTKALKAIGAVLADIK